MQHTDERSLKELLGDLTQSVSTLFRKEIELVRTETSEKLSGALVAAGSIAAGGILAIAALIMLLQALVVWLTELGLGFVSPVHEGMVTELGLAPALAALIVGGGVAIIAFVLMYKGTNALKASNLAPTRTVESLRRDAQMIQEQAQ